MNILKFCKNAFNKMPREKSRIQILHIVHKHIQIFIHVLTKVVQHIFQNININCY